MLLTLIVIEQDLQKIMKSGSGLETVILIFLQILTYFTFFMQDLISLFWKSFCLITNYFKSWQFSTVRRKLSRDVSFSGHMSLGTHLLKVVVTS